MRILRITSIIARYSKKYLKFCRKTLHINLDRLKDRINIIAVKDEARSLISEACFMYDENYIQF